MRCKSDELPLPKYLVDYDRGAHSLTCTQLLKGNQSAYAVARALMEKHPVNRVADEEISIQVKDCEVM